MEKKDLTRRDFIKATAAVTTVATGSVLVGKEISDRKYVEAAMDDLETVNEPAPISCLDYINAMKKKS